MGCELKARLICMHNSDGILWVGGWVGPRARLGFFGKQKNLVLLNGIATFLVVTV